MRNGCATVQDFCRHMGIKWTDLVAGKGATLQHVGFLVGTSADDLERFAVKTQGYQRYTVNFQALTSWTTRRQNLRLCPACYVEDIPKNCVAASYGRVEWQLREFRICPLHMLQILTLPTSEYPRSPYDFAGRASDYHQRILAAEEEVKPQTQRAVVEP
ncbi:TniQ family protein [Shimia sp.]|uniref:TniQ family protein n=1 Tax=Shimia sp. TaxID=1954381 RepID=UPI003BAC4A29